MEEQGEVREGVQMAMEAAAEVEHVGEAPCPDPPQTPCPGTRAQEEVYPAPLHSHEEVVRDSVLFMQSLRFFHSSMGTKFMNPVIGRKELNLHLLYVEVTRRGGLENAIQTKKWKEVVCLFNFPPTITSASYVLRKYYLSLLHHYEQVYFFRAQGPFVPLPASLQSMRSMAKLEKRLIASNSTIKKEKTTGKRPLPDETPLHNNNGAYYFAVTGSIDGKFEHGYMVTVKMGSEILRGVLYRFDQPPLLPAPDIAIAPPVSVVPLAAAQPQDAAVGNGWVQPRRCRRRKFRRYHDPAFPKPNRSAYNFFFAEKHAKLKAEFPNGDVEYSKIIGQSWNKLTEDERKVFKEHALNDKERYKKELLEYKGKYEASTSTGIKKSKATP